jgi:hypothetical protein
MGNEPTYKISKSVKDGILEIILTGELTESDALKMTNEVSDIVKANSVNKVIVDVRDLNGRLNTEATYLRVKSYPPHMYRVRFAMVDIEEQNAYEHFYENTAINAGMTVKCFTDINVAREWLNSDDAYLSKNSSYCNKIELESHCKELISAFKGVLSWTWDSRYETVLAEFGIEKKDVIHATLKRNFSTSWDRDSIKKAPDVVQHINSYLGKLWRRQMLFTSDTNRDAFIYCAWWPWEDGNNISIRMAPFYKKLLNSEKAVQMQQFKSWFGIQKH